MAGEAPDLGDAVLAGILAPILAALGGDSTPTQAPIPVAPSIARPALIFGLPAMTFALLAGGAFLLFKLAK